jgi:hypothetical protein
VLLRQSLARHYYWQSAVIWLISNKSSAFPENPSVFADLSYFFEEQKMKNTSLYKTELPVSNPKALYLSIPDNLLTAKRSPLGIRQSEEGSNNGH